jgi:hypothetical protein
MLVAEEVLFTKYSLHPTKNVGFAGLFGASIYVVFLTIVQFIPCHSDSLCPDGRLDKVTEAFRQYGENTLILVFSICLVCSIACFNTFGCSVTKYASAAQRSTIDVSRTVIIWIVFMLLPSSDETFFYVQLIGFIIVTFGTLLYNEILVIPWFGFNRNLK